jgi:hypothetical protein
MQLIRKQKQTPGAHEIAIQQTKLPSAATKIHNKKVLTAAGPASK